MKKIWFLLLLVSFSFALNIYSKVNESDVIFIIDGVRNAETNLTLFLLKNNVQINADEKINVLLPYYLYISYNETANYELRVLDQNNSYAEKKVSVSVKAPVKIEESEEKPKKEGAEYAIIAAVIGLIIILYLSIRFIKFKSGRK